MALIGLLLSQLVLIEKKQQLTGQLADAKEKEHVDRREKLVVWHGLPLPASGPAPRLTALCEDEICSHH